MRLGACYRFAICVALILAISVPRVSAQSDAFQRAAADFASLTVASRYDVQMWLIVAGYIGRGQH